MGREYEVCAFGIDGNYTDDKICECYDVISCAFVRAEELIKTNRKLKIYSIYVSSLKRGEIFLATWRRGKGWESR